MTGTSYRCILRCARPTVAWVRAFRDPRERDLPIAWSADLSKELTSPMSTLSEANPATPQAPTVAARTVDAVKIYGKDDNEVRVLDGVTIEFAAGEFTAIMGPSGSGKSTLMHCCAGLDTLTSGEVWVGDRSLSSMSERELTLMRRDRLGFVFQAYNLVPTLTAAENINLPVAPRGARSRQGVGRLG